MDFRERFGLDYLISRPRVAGSSKPSADTTLPQGLNEALISYGSRVMAALNQVPDQRVRLFDLAKQLSARVDTLLPVMNYLGRSGYVERIEDPIGNDAFGL